MLKESISAYANQYVVSGDFLYTCKVEPVKWAGRADSGRFDHGPGSLLRAWDGAGWNTTHNSKCGLDGLA